MILNNSHVHILLNLMLDIDYLILKKNQEFGLKIILMKKI